MAIPRWVSVVESSFFPGAIILVEYIFLTLIVIEKNFPDRMVH
jgi:hypothetical protein